MRPRPTVAHMVEYRSHQDRPAHDRHRALYEPQCEQQADACRRGRTTRRGIRWRGIRRRRTACACPRSIARQAPKRREDQIGESLDREEQCRVSHRATQLVDDELLEPCHHEGEVEHRDEQKEARPGDRRSRCRGRCRICAGEKVRGHEVTPRAIAIVSRRRGTNQLAAGVRSRGVGMSNALTRPTASYRSSAQSARTCARTAFAFAASR